LLTLTITILTIKEIILIKKLVSKLILNIYHYLGFILVVN